MSVVRELMVSGFVVQNAALEINPGPPLNAVLTLTRNSDHLLPLKVGDPFHAKVPEILDVEGYVEAVEPDVEFNNRNEAEVPTDPRLGGGYDKRMTYRVRVTSYAVMGTKLPIGSPIGDPLAGATEEHIAAMRLDRTRYQSCFEAVCGALKLPLHGGITEMDYPTVLPGEPRAWTLKPREGLETRVSIELHPSGYTASTLVWSVTYVHGNHMHLPCAEIQKQDDGRWAWCLRYYGDGPPKWTHVPKA